MWFNTKKKQFLRFPSFRFCPRPKIENSEIWEGFILFKFSVAYETQNRKNNLKEKTLFLRCGLRRKNVHFRGFRVLLDFALYLKSSFRFQTSQRLKPFIEFQINIPRVLISQAK